MTPQPLKTCLGRAFHWAYEFSYWEVVALDGPTGLRRLSFVVAVLHTELAPPPAKFNYRLQIANHQTLLSTLSLFNWFHKHIDFVGFFGPKLVHGA